MIKANASAKDTAALTADASYWSPAETPKESDSWDVVLNETFTTFSYGTVSFPNLTITDPGRMIYNSSWETYVKELHVVAHSQFIANYSNDTREHTFHANFFVHDCWWELSGWNSRRTNLDGSVYGTGKISARHGDAVGMRFSCDCSGFAGDFVLTGLEAKANERPKFFFGLSHKNALGGPYAGTTGWKSVAISTCPWFVVNCDLDVTEPTRGLYLSGQPTFEIEKNKTMTVTEAMTYSGEVTKRGAGRLVLGNAAPQFSLAGAAPTDTPTEGTNVLNVVEGSLEVAAVDAVNGLAVSFGETATLVVNVEATGDLKTYGARNVKWETPFAADAAIPVVFEGEVTDDDLTVAVCTISATAAAPTFDVPVTYAHRMVTAAGWRTNADGTKTYEVTLEKMGVILLVR